MAKRVNNIAYKGINHSPSLVSDNDGHASECVNLSPDYNDLKPMPMPVKREGYQVGSGHSLVFVHQGIDYENYIEIDETHTRLVFKDEDGNILYYVDGDNDYWTNESEVLAIEAIGNTVIVSTKDGVEYIIFQPDVPVTGQTSGGSYKPIGQRPPMPVIEFRMHSEDDYKKYWESYKPEDIIPAYYGTDYYDTQTLLLKKDDEPIVRELIQGQLASLEKRLSEDNKFCQPIYIRYAYRLKTNDYIMQSPPVLLLPSTDKCPFLSFISHEAYENLYGKITSIQTSVIPSSLQYMVKAIVGVGTTIDDWNDIIDSVDVFVSLPIRNFDSGNIREPYVDADIGVSPAVNTYQVTKLPPVATQDLGEQFADGSINKLIDYYSLLSQVPVPYHFYPIKSTSKDLLDKNIKQSATFFKLHSFELSELVVSNTFTDMPVELANLATMPTLEDDYNSHCAVSPLLMQVYNSRLNMANISQKVFNGFGIAYHPQSDDRHYHGVVNYINPGHIPVYGDIDINLIMFNVRKNGKVYTVSPSNANDDPGERLDYTSYIYYPDADCFEAVVYCSISYGGQTYWLYYTIPMTRHEHLNGSFWYGGTDCLGEYIASQYRIGEGSSTSPVTVDSDTWYDIPNRFMMSSVGNPWHFPIGNQFDIGRREIRALSLNAENMNAPQFGQNPIYVFSADGIWTIAINADGTFNKLSYVSGDVVSEMATLGSSPTASGTQVVFFKTSRGVSAIVGSAVKEIDLVMKGRLFNPRTMLLPQGSIVDGVPTAGFNSYWLDIIFKSCDSLPYADFARQSNLLYDYRNDRLLLYNKAVAYMYVYDIKRDFWSKMLPLVVDESGASPAQEEYNTRRNVSTLTHFNGTAMVGSNAILTDDEGYLWDVGGQPDENDINGHHFGLYVSRPLRFGTDDMKTLSRIIHDYQLTNDEYLVQDPNPESVRMALYGSRNGKDYYQVKTLRGTAYKFYIIVLYTKMLASSRYAYTAFEWEARMTDKIR